jgi:hypothetical protein
MENVDYLLAAIFMTQPAQRFQHRHVWLPGPVLFDALAAPDARRAIVRDRIKEFFNESGLADASFAGNKEYGRSPRVPNNFAPAPFLRPTIGFDLC